MPTITAREYLDPDTGLHYESRNGPAGSGIGRTEYVRDPATGRAVDTWVQVAPGSPIADRLQVIEPPECPGWCDLPAGHPFDAQDVLGDDQSRSHEHAIGELVAVLQFERRDGDGTVTDWPPAVDLNIDHLEAGLMTVATAEALALQLQAAARFVRLLDGGPSDGHPCYPDGLGSARHGRARTSENPTQP